jgi:hypothetical protein
MYADGKRALYLRLRRTDVYSVSVHVVRSLAAVTAALAR